MNIKGIFIIHPTVNIKSEALTHSHYLRLGREGMMHSMYYCIFKFIYIFSTLYDLAFLQGKPWIPGGGKSIFTVGIH